MIIYCFQGVIRTKFPNLTKICGWPRALAPAADNCPAKAALTGPAGDVQSFRHFNPLFDP
jgi:hypothetical protein